MAQIKTHRINQRAPVETERENDRERERGRVQTLMGNEHKFLWLMNAAAAWTKTHSVYPSCPGSIWSHFYACPGHKLTFKLIGGAFAGLVALSLPAHYTPRRSRIKFIPNLRAVGQHFMSGWMAGCLALHFGLSNFISRPANCCKTTNSFGLGGAGPVATKL